jgi:hypothetical protein
MVYESEWVEVSAEKEIKKEKKTLFNLKSDRHFKFIWLESVVQQIKRVEQIVMWKFHGLKQIEKEVYGQWLKIV